MNEQRERAGEATEARGIDREKDRSENRSGQWAVQREVMAALSSTLFLPQALQRGLRSLGEAFPADGVFANTFVAERREVRFLAHATRTEARELHDVVPAAAGCLPIKSARGDGLVVVEDINDDPFTKAVALKVIPEVRSYLMVSLQLEGRHLGVVCFYSRRPGAFRTVDLELPAAMRMLLALQVGFALGIRLDRHNRKLEGINRELKRSLALAKDTPLTELLRNTPSFVRLKPVIEQAASYAVPVLITGESGTGKEVLANTIHGMSSRAMRPCVRVNCAAIPEALIEAELFGHEAGAFTDARRRRRGLFEEADGGTIFLDEIGELPLAVQGKLLHVLQHQVIRRVGASEEIPINVRVISATNRDLADLVARGLFRLDLYYRLNVLCLRIPPLRERPEDLRPLIELFAREVKERFEVPLAESFVDALCAQALQWKWPGNVRELRNAVIRSGLAASQHEKNPRLIVDAISEANIPGAPKSRAPQRQGAAGGFEERGNISESDWASGQEKVPPAVTGEPSGEAPRRATKEPAGLEDFESMQRRYFKRLLDSCHGRISGEHGAARIAGLHPSTLRSRLEKLGLAAGKAARKKNAQDEKAAKVKEGAAS